jgi:hypothetical protein
MPGGFTGNGSVEWFVDADNPRGSPVSKPDPNPQKPNRHHQSGIDDFGDAAYEFTIAVKIPKNTGARPDAQRQFAAALRDAAKRVEAAPPNSGTTVSFTIPVEDRAHGGPTKDQILISWDPATTAV